MGGMMSDKIQHECRVSWGMIIGDTGHYVDDLIEDKKKEVREAFALIGYEVKDQHFIMDCEWGTLITWAELIQPFNGYYSRGDTEVTFGHFYDEEEQRKYLNTRKLNSKK